MQDQEEGLKSDMKEEDRVLRIQQLRKFYLSLSLDQTKCTKARKTKSLPIEDFDEEYEYFDQNQWEKEMKNELALQKHCLFQELGKAQCQNAFLDEVERQLEILLKQLEAFLAKAENLKMPKDNAEWKKLQKSKKSFRDLEIFLQEANRSFTLPAEMQEL